MACMIRSRAVTAAGTDFELDLKYEMIKPIGHGAYGVVISARDHESNSKVSARHKIHSKLLCTLSPRATPRITLYPCYGTRANRLPHFVEVDVGVPTSCHLYMFHLTCPQSAPNAWCGFSAAHGTHRIMPVHSPSIVGAVGRGAASAVDYLVCAISR